MLNCKFRPLAEWPGSPTPSWKQKTGNFKASWSQTLDLLERELNHLRAKNIIIEGYFEFGQIRNDGWPKSSARPSKPGVVLSFDLGKTGKAGRMVMPCDGFNNWESNLRAIALTLEHLRAVERYGVTTEKAEQYTGWLKLPAASQDDEAIACAKTLVFHANVSTPIEQVVNDRDTYSTVWRVASLRTHPDTQIEGKTIDDFRAVMSARDRLGILKGWV